MDFLLPGSTPNLAQWEQRPFAKDVEQGPRSADRRDQYPTRRILAAICPRPIEVAADKVIALGHGRRRARQFAYNNVAGVPLDALGSVAG